MGIDFIAVTRRCADSNDVASGSANTQSKMTKTKIKVADSERKRNVLFVDILKTSFDNIAGAVVLTRRVLSNSVGEGVVGGSFAAGGHVEVTKINTIVGRDKTLGNGKIRNKKN